MKGYSGSQVRTPHIMCFLPVLFLFVLENTYGQEQTTYPLLKVDSLKFHIGNHSIDFSARNFTDTNGDNPFPYDSVASHHDFDLAIDTFFGKLHFKDQKKYGDLKNEVQGWNYPEVLNQLNVASIGSNVNPKWRSLPLRQAIATALIAYVKSDEKYHLYIDNGQLEHIYIRDPKIIAIDSTTNTLILKTVPANTIPTPPPIEPETASSSNSIWLYLLLFLLLIGLGIVCYLLLQYRKNSLTVDDILSLSHGKPVRAEHRLSEKNKLLLHTIKREIAYKNNGGSENEAHKKIVLHHMDLIGQLDVSQEKLPVLRVIIDYLNKNASKVGTQELTEILSFLEQRDQIRQRSPKERAIDMNITDALHLFYGKDASGHLEKITSRLQEFTTMEKDVAQLLKHTRAGSMALFSENVRALFNGTNTADDTTRALESLALFEFKEQTLQEYEKALKLNPAISALSHFLTSKQEAEETPLAQKLLRNLNTLFEKLSGVVPEMTYDRETLSVEIIKAGLFQKFLDDQRTGEQHQKPLEKSEVIAQLKIHYSELKPKGLPLNSFDVDTFIATELLPYMDRITKVTMDFEQENKYLLQFHNRYHQLLTRLESSQTLENKDRIQFFENLFSITFHILDYLKIKLELPKTDGADINFGLILEGKTVNDLPSETYKVITKSYRATPIEVRHILELAKQVGIKNLDDLLFNGIYIDPESLNDSTDEKN